MSGATGTKGFAGSKPDMLVVPRFMDCRVGYLHIRVSGEDRCLIPSRSECHPDIVAAVLGGRKRSSSRRQAKIVLAYSLSSIVYLAYTVFVQM